MRYLFGDYSFSIFLWGLKDGWFAGFVFFLSIVCTILFDVYFGKFVMTFIDIGEIGCMSMTKCLVKQTRFFCMMLPVGVVLCILGQYGVFPPLAAIFASRCRSILATRRCRRSTGISAHLSSRAWRSAPNSGADCPYWRLHDPIHPKYALWDCSQAILKVAPSWWRRLAEGNQGLPEHGEVWHYRHGRENYPRNAAWQMALRCLTKCPCRAHRWGICWGAQEAIWHHCEKLLRYVLNHHQLGPYTPSNFAGSVYLVKDVS